jgi:glutamyl-tRNA reductase
MLDQLIVINTPAHLCERLNHSLSKNVFLLKTCQRELLIIHQTTPTIPEGAEIFSGENAYYYLLEVICGLKSRLVGENEIVNQFKDAYQAFMKLDQKNPFIVRILEKLFQDAKDIRTKYLIGLSQKTYASISRRKLVSENKANEVLILGSGLLAEDMINQLKKKTEILISARNLTKVAELAQKHNLKVIPWKEDDRFSQYDHIVNTIGTDEIILNEKFFYDWYSKTKENRLFIDLGSPSSIKTTFEKEQGVIRLDNIFEEGAIKDEQKLEKIKEARLYMDQIIDKRKVTFMPKAGINNDCAYL